jgi:hypothetical protein
MPTACGRGRLLLAFVACAALIGCEKYPPAESVGACAAARFGEKTGSFSVERRSSSALFGEESAIIYQKSGSPDRAIVIYNRSNGPVTTFQDISYGNHAEIKGAVEAIEYCAQSAGDRAMPAPQGIASPR